MSQQFDSNGVSRRDFLNGAVETTTYANLAPKEIRAMLDRVGLKAPSTFEALPFDANAARAFGQVVAHVWQTAAHCAQGAIRPSGKVSVNVLPMPISLSTVSSPPIQRPGRD